MPGDAMTPLVRRCDISDSRDMLDITESTLIDEAIEKADAKHPIEPMERNDPTLPIDRVDPTEPIDRNESLDAMDHFPLRDVSMGRGYACAHGCGSGRRVAWGGSHTPRRWSRPVPRLARVARPAAEG